MLTRRSAVILLSIVANFFCFSRVVGDDVGASAAFTAGSEVYQIVGICATFFVVSAILIYVISVFGMRERTFEEALEQQRMKQGGAPLLIQPSRKTSKGAAVNKNEKKKKEPKKKAQPKQQPKNVAAPESDAASADEVMHVAEEAPVENIALPPLPVEEEEISPVEESVTTAVAQESKAAKKRRNKRKESTSAEEEAVILNGHVEEEPAISHEAEVAEQDSGVEMERADISENAVPEEVDEAVAEEIVASIVADEPDVALAEVSVEIEASPASEGSPEDGKDRRKKRKKTALAVEEEALSPLSDAEMIVQLKALLEEKEKIMKETKISHGSLQTRLGENRGWLKAERAKVAELEFQLSEVTHLKQIEVQSLNQQQQQKQRDSQTERANLQSQISALQDKMQEAGAEAHGRLQQLQGEAKSWREAADRQRKDYEGRIQQLEDEKQRAKQAAGEEARNTFNHQMQELRDKLQQSESRCTAVSQDLSEAQRANNDRAGELENAVGLRETQISQLNSQLTEAENSRNAMDTQLKMLETRLQENIAQHKETQSKLLIAEESLLQQQTTAVHSNDGQETGSDASAAEVAQLQNAVAAKDAQISMMQGELESIKLEVLNLVNQDKSKAEEEKATKEELESLMAKSKEDIAAVQSQCERGEATKKELEGKLAELTSQLSTKVDPEAEQIRIIEALKEIQSTTASNISREESSESVDAMVEALKTSFALHLLPTSLTSGAEEFFTQHLKTAFNKLVDKQIKSKENDYQTQVKALEDALNVQIEDPEENIKEDQKGEEISKLQAELDEIAAASASVEKELSERQAELETKAAIVLGLESTIAETKQQLIQLQNSLTEEADSAAKLRDLVASKEAEIVDANLRLEATKEELVTSVEKAIDAAVAKSTLVFDEEKGKMEEEAKVKETYYNALLKETEGMLCKLQISVEAEEKKWTAKLKVKEDELLKWKNEREDEEKLSKEVQEAFLVDLKARVSSLEEEKEEWEAEKREIHSRLASAEECLDREKESSESAAVLIEETKGSLEAKLKKEMESKEDLQKQLETTRGELEAELKKEMESKEGLQKQLETARSAAETSRGEFDALTTRLTTANEALEKASKGADDAASQKRAAEESAASLKKEMETLKSQLAVALTTTPSKKDKKEMKSEEKKKQETSKNGDASDGELGASSNGAGDNVSIGGVSIGGGGEEKKKKGKSLSKLFSPKSK